jgi:hypothetical protein
MTEALYHAQQQDNDNDNDHDNDSDKYRDSFSSDSDNVNDKDSDGDNSHSNETEGLEAYMYAVFPQLSPQHLSGIAPSLSRLASAQSSTARMSLWLARYAVSRVRLFVCLFVCLYVCMCVAIR